MKKFSFLIFLFLMGCYASTGPQTINYTSDKPVKNSDIFFSNENIIVVRWSDWSGNTMKPAQAASYCKKYNKFFIKPSYAHNQLKRPYHTSYYCVKDENEFFSNIEKFENAAPAKYFNWGWKKTVPLRQSEIQSTNIPNLKYKSLDEYLFANNIDPNKPQKIEFDISDKKTQCEAIGFKPETEKFADCVLRLVELDVKQQTQNQIAVAQNNGNDALVKQLQRQNNLQSSQALIDLGQQLMNPKRYNSNIYLPQTQRCFMQGFGTFATMRCR